MKKIELNEKARKILKWTGWIAGGIFAFLLLLLLIALIFINPIAKSLIQSIGSEATGTEVTVEDIDISLFSGEVVISGITVGCPEGYSAGGHTAKLGNVVVKWDAGSVFSDELVIREVKLKDVSVNHEQKDPNAPDSNFTAILACVEKYSETDAGEEPEEEGQKVRLEKIEIENVQVCAYVGNAEKPAVTVTLENLNAAPMDGAAEIVNLIVGNPPGFEANEFAISLGNVIAGIDPETLDAEKLVIREVTLKDVQINHEKIIGSNDNLNTLIGYVDVITGANQPQEKEPEEEDGQKIQLDKLGIDNVKLRAFVSGSQVVGIPVTLPVIGPIGEGEEGLTGGEVFSEVCKSIYKALLEKLTSAGGLLLDTTGDGVKKFGDGVKEGIEDIGNEAKKIFQF